MVFIFDSYNRVACDTLANVVDNPFALHHDYLNPGRDILGERLRNQEVERN
jgi:hypothetical protein